MPPVAAKARRFPHVQIAGRRRLLGSIAERNSLDVVEPRNESTAPFETPDISISAETALQLWIRQPKNSGCDPFCRHMPMASVENAEHRKFLAKAKLYQFHPSGHQEPAFDINPPQRQSRVANLNESPDKLMWSEQWLMVMDDNEFCIITSAGFSILTSECCLVGLNLLNRRFKTFDFGRATGHRFRQDQRASAFFAEEVLSRTRDEYGPAKSQTRTNSSNNAAECRSKSRLSPQQQVSGC